MSALARRSAVVLVVAFSAASSSCSAGDAFEVRPPGAVASHAEAVSRARGVPTDLVLAIGVVEGGLTLPRWRTPNPEDHVPVAGILELRHGKLNTLALGAAALGTDEEALRADTDLGTEAGVSVLASLGPHGEASVAKWHDAVAELSGLAEPERSRYVAAVFQTLRFGGDFPARDGEIVHIAAHADVPPAFLFAPPPLTTDVDFPGSEWFQTDCTNKCTANRPDGDASVDTIVIHDTEGGWDASVATLQYDTGKSVHYLIDADGSRWGQFVPESYTAWHAGNWCYNKHSVGIEHVGVASDKAGYQTALYLKSAEMVKNIMTRWSSMKLDRDHIVGHYQIPNGNAINECSPACADTLDACETSPNYGGSNNHRDPGYYWQWCQYMELLGTTCHCNDAWPLWNCTSDKTEAWRCSAGKVEKQDCANGCDVMPVGQEDVCHAAPDAGAPDAESDAAGSGGSDAGKDAGSAGKDAGTDAGVTKKSAAGGDASGGCGCRAAPARERSGAGALLALALAFGLGRRHSRRRAA